MSSQSDFQIVTDHLRHGRHKAALKLARTAIKRHKTNPIFANLAGIALCSLGQHRNALPYFQKALKTAPDLHDARKNLGQTLLFLEQYNTAIRSLSKLVEKTPEDSQAWYLLAVARLEVDELDGALDAIKHSLDLEPVSAQSHNLQGLALYRKGHFVEATDCFRESLRLSPDNVEVLINASRPLSEQMLHDEAQSVLEHAVAVAPDNTGARYWLSSQYMAAGNTEKAIAGFLELLKLNPKHAPALERLVAMQGLEANTGLKPQILAALDGVPGNSYECAQLLIALGRVEDQQGNKQKAENAWCRGKKILAKLRPYDQKQDEQYVDKIISRFNRSWAARTELLEGSKPIFVLGLPRSGTTLTEAVLGAHSRVVSLGERKTTTYLLQQIVNSDLPFDEQRIAEFVRNDQAQLPEMPQSTLTYVDKMPENYRWAGYLLAAYPDCRIISVVRDPRDIALSMWRANFGSAGLNYVNDLQAMAFRFNLYAKLMDHWHKAFPDRILTLAYEDLVQDISGASQKLADWCGLDWEEAMARPNENAGQVLTLSAYQVRQEVHSKSIGGWRDHERMLAPLIDGLSPDLWPNL